VGSERQGPLPLGDGSGGVRTLRRRGSPDSIAGIRTIMTASGNVKSRDGGASVARKQGPFDGSGVPERIRRWDPVSRALPPRCVVPKSNARLHTFDFLVAYPLYESPIVGFRHVQSGHRHCFPSSDRCKRFQEGPIVVGSRSETRRHDPPVRSPIFRLPEQHCRTKSGPSVFSSVA